MEVNNRTEPLYQGTNNTNSLSLGITTFCSMKCPKCTIDVPYLMLSKQAKHGRVEDMIRDAALMRPLKRVLITGGEPTLHPEFKDIARGVRTWFGAETVSIETNGYFYHKYEDLFFSCFDRVFITHYIKDAIYPNSPDNTEIIRAAEKRLGNRLIREPPVVHEREHYLLPLDVRNAPEQPCTKYYSPGLPAGWYDGLLYACCVAVGIDRNLGRPVTPDWREWIQTADLGCRNCCYRGT